MAKPNRRFVSFVFFAFVCVGCGDETRPIVCHRVGGGWHGKDAGVVVRKCCPGLTEISNDFAYLEESGECAVLPSGGKICLPCGDGYCDPDHENPCNCARDCSLETTNRVLD